MKAHLKTLDQANINAPLLREFLIKDLTEASIIAISEKIAQLHNQIQVLSKIQMQLINRPKREEIAKDFIIDHKKEEVIDPREDLHNDLIAALNHEDGE